MPANSVQLERDLDHQVDRLVAGKPIADTNDAELRELSETAARLANFAATVPSPGPSGKQKTWRRVFEGKGFIKPRATAVVFPSATPALLDPRIELTPEQKGRIAEAIERLSPEQRQVIFLRFFEHLEYEQVARELGLMPLAVRVIQFQALSEVSRLLEVEHVA